MARRRKQTLLERLSGVSIISILINPVSMMLMMAFVAIFLWNRYHHRMDLAVNKTISPNALHLNQDADWISVDIGSMAIQDSRLNEIRLDRPDAIEKVVASLAVQPWVKEVLKVTKSPNGIHVDLEYRKPIAIVEIGKEKVVPVDSDTVVLDGAEFVIDNVQDFWRISMPIPILDGLSTGRIWPDIRVADSVQIANAWQGAQTEVGLIRILNRSQPTRDRLRLRDYELWTPAGVIVIWGSPPGLEKKGEASAREKVIAIQQYVRNNGSLDSPGNHTLDVRQGRVVPSINKLAMDLDFLRIK